MRRILIIFGAVLICFCARAQAREIDYTSEIEPLFKKRCYACHGPAQQLSGLRLDHRDAALKGGYSGPVIVPGDAQNSKLVELIAGAGTLVMPPAGPRLTAGEIELVRSWINQGARWSGEGGTAKPGSASRRSSSHWSFRPVRKPVLPAVGGSKWPKTPIDRFILARLAQLGIEPSLPADRRTLLRRLHLDLTGLPPSLAAMNEFLGDSSPDAVARTVDQLLASPHFGEKWARHWLDLARYADSDGYEQDQVRRDAWRYREWVIQAFNSNMPFDRFTVEQVAGDLLPGAGVEQLIATGFHRNTLTSREGGVDVDQLRAEQVADRTSTTASVWLGLTMDCARCHDHKYDPISQKDYYRFYAFFNSAVEVNHPAPLAGEMGSYLQSRPEFDKRLAAIREKCNVEKLMPGWESEVRAAIQDPEAKLEWTQVADYVRVYVDHGHEIVRTPQQQRTYGERLALLRVFLKYPGPLASEPEGKGIEFGKGFNEFEKLILEFPPLSEVPAMARSAAPVKTHIHLRGDFRSPGIEVEAGTPEVLPDLPEGVERDRLALARWLVSGDNPLTARVFVNRVWQELFGAGIVESSDDFGTRGDAPSNLDLLDWLAAEFMDNGWNVKQLIRSIVLSTTYGQSSHARADLTERDPSNRLLGRQSRLRLPAELIRDSALSVSGLLNPATGGRSVRPPMPASVLEVAYRAKWEESQGAERYRRGLYTLLQRSVPYPQLVNFDAPSSLVTCSRRMRSITPLQSLNLLNDPVFVEASQAFAARVLRERSGTDEERMKYAFELALGRRPSADELSSLVTYVQRKQRSLTEQAALKQFPGSMALDIFPQQAAAWFAAASVLLNLDEFITRE